MSDLISRQEAIERIKKQKDRQQSFGIWEHNDKIAATCYDIIAEAIERLPNALCNKTNGEVIQALFPNIDNNFSNIIDLRLWWNRPYKGNKAEPKEKER